MLELQARESVQHRHSLVNPYVLVCTHSNEKEEDERASNPRAEKGRRDGEKKRQKQESTHVREKESFIQIPYSIICQNTTSNAIFIGKDPNPNLTLSLKIANN